MARQQPFHCEAEGLVLRGTLYLPDTFAGPLPTVVLLHGFGANRMEATGLFVMLARALADAGHAVIAYDRAGHGESDGSFFDVSVTRDVRHTHAVLDAVRQLAIVDPARLHLVGMSLGAIVAAVVAAESIWPPASLTLWSSAGIFVEEITGGHLQGRPLATLDTQGWFDFLGLRMGPAMREDALGFDLIGRVAPYRGPVLLLHGDADFVPVRSAEQMRAAFGPKATLQVVPGAEHGWTCVEHREQLIARTLDFLSSQPPP